MLHNPYGVCYGAGVYLISCVKKNSYGITFKWAVFFICATIAFSERYEGRTSRKPLF